MSHLEGHQRTMIVAAADLFAGFDMPEPNNPYLQGMVDLIFDLTATWDQHEMADTVKASIAHRIIELID